MKALPVFRPPAENIDMFAFVVARASALRHFEMSLDDVRHMAQNKRRPLLTHLFDMLNQDGAVFGGAFILSAQIDNSLIFKRTKH